MAAPMLAAAAVGFISSKATSFVLTPAGNQATNAVATTTTGYQPAAAQPSAAVGTGALAAGLSLGFAGVAASVKPRTRATVRQAGFDPTSSLGVCNPTGYWDPCGLMKERDGKDGFTWKDEETFNKYRVAELKHGRVAMIATVGLVTTTFWKFPTFEDIPGGLAALDTSTGGAGFGVLFIMAAWFEINYPTGDFDVPGPWGATEEMKGKEIANGRLAMAAVMTLLITEAGTGLTPAGQFADTFANLAGSGGFYTAWAILIGAFAWTQPKASTEVSWSTKNFLASKGLGEKPAALPAFSAPALLAAGATPYTNVEPFAHRLPAGPNQPASSIGGTKLPEGIYFAPTTTGVNSVTISMKVPEAPKIEAKVEEKVEETA